MIVLQLLGRNQHGVAQQSGGASRRCRKCVKRTQPLRTRTPWQGQDRYSTDRMVTARKRSAQALEFVRLNLRVYDGRYHFWLIRTVVRIFSSIHFSVA